MVHVTGAKKWDGVVQIQEGIQIKGKTYNWEFDIG